MSVRLSLAADSGALDEFSGAPVLVIGTPSGFDLSPFDGSPITVVQPMQPDANHWEQQGVDVVPEIPPGPFAVTLVVLPRAKADARARIAAAMSITEGIVLIDGQKTDGIDSILKDMRKRADILGTLSKAHGKLFWMAPITGLQDWLAAPSRNIDGFLTAPGVFSADGVDPGSALLAGAMPALSGDVIDLGAGWGYLAARVLANSPKIKTLHLVEANAVALDCARQNVTDPRAQFHWADARGWSGLRGADAVITNPPFHTGRSADQDLGRAFILSAVRVLRPGGILWMVANRHLAYEGALRECFTDVAEIGGDTRYKLLRAKASRAKV